MSVLAVSLLVVGFFLAITLLLIWYQRSLSKQSMERMLAVMNEQEEKHQGKMLEEIRKQGSHVSEDTSRQLKLLAEHQLALMKSNQSRLHENQQSMEGSLKNLSTHLRTEFNQTRTQIDKKISDMMKNLGEFEQLSGYVKTLSRTLSDVKQRGQFGESHLGDIITDVIPDTYYRKEYPLQSAGANGARVDFVIRMPEKDAPWLPIDSKYPQEDYQRLLAAREAMDKTAEQAALKSLQQFVKSKAKEIKHKYIHAPETTDFAILFIPQESAFYEIYQHGRFIHQIREEFQIIITGPYLFYALLESIRLGYNKLAIEGNLQQILGGLQTLQKGLETLGGELGDAEKKARILHEKLGKGQRRTGKLHALTHELTKLENPDEPSKKQSVPQSPHPALSEELQEPLFAESQYQTSANTHNDDSLEFSELTPGELAREDSLSHYRDQSRTP